MSGILDDAFLITKIYISKAEALASVNSRIVGDRKVSPFGAMFGA
jgi:hypothetical protein